MIIIYKYILYHCYKLYKDKWNSEIPETYAVCFVSLIQYFNLITLWIIVQLNINNLPELDGYIHASVIAILIGINFLMHSKTIRNIEAARGADRKAFHTIGWFAGIYSLVSILVVLVLISF